MVQILSFKWFRLTLFHSSSRFLLSTSSIAISEFPEDIFTLEQLRQGAVLLHVLCVSISSAGFTSRTFQWKKLHFVALALNQLYQCSTSYILQAIYMFYALAIVCDVYFVPSLEKVSEVWKTYYIYCDVKDTTIACCLYRSRSLWQQVKAKAVKTSLSPRRELGACSPPPRLICHMYWDQIHPDHNPDLDPNQMSPVHKHKHYTHGCFLIMSSEIHKTF